MTQSQIDRLVSNATGEPLREIHHRGFGLADALEVHFDPEPYQMRPQTVDWDALDAERPSLYP